MKIPLELGDNLELQEKMDQYVEIEIELNTSYDGYLAHFYLNKEQASQVIEHLRKVFEL